MIKTLQFLRIVDEDGRLSITNIAVFIALYKLAMTQTTPMDMGVLFTSLLNYAHTKHLRSKVKDIEGIVNGSDN